MRRVRRKVANKEKVFGCDLLEHLAACSQEIPPVLKTCSEFVEEQGIVDGIYRLSGVSSNIQKLRSEFDSDGSPDLHKDVYLQDIHCVSSLCKAYFRELPNPLLTYQLYDKFAEAVAIQLEEERLVKIRDVLKELPPPHYRTLEFLMRHLVKMASHSPETNMHARNLAIVWAPNLLRSKDIETSGFNGTAAFMEVRVQSIVVEFILTHVSQLFPERGVQAGRRKSLPSPSVMPNQEEPFFRHAPVQCTNSYGNISPGDGPLAMRSYHSIIENTDKRKGQGSLKSRKWMSIFNIGGRFHDQRRRNKHSAKEKDLTPLRPAKSMDCLSSPSSPNDGSIHTTQRPPSTIMMSHLAVPSPQAGSEVPAGGLGGSSGYAVTYRRGTGVVSGGSGTQGTYNLLDPKGEAGATGGAGEGQTHQSRSPGMSSKTGRRAAMHITGPQYVTVPLHITSNLLRGGGGDRVIHYGRERDRGGAAGREGGGEKAEVKDAEGETTEQGEEDGRADVKVEATKGAKQNGQSVRQEEEEVERGREEKCSADEEAKSVEETGEGAKEKGDEEAESKECLSDLRALLAEGAESREGEQGSDEQNSSMGENSDHDHDNAEDTEDEDDDDYMDMTATQHTTTVPDSPISESGVCGDDSGDDSASDVSHILNSTEVEVDEQELSGYVQDNFDFLDDMDSNQMNEFSVEAPFCENEYEFMEEQRLPPPPSTETPQRQRSETAPQPIEVPPPTQVRSHRPLSDDAYVRHMKSRSLPYMPAPLFPVSMSSEDDDEDEDGADDSDEEDENMFYKSLPSGYMTFSSPTWYVPGADAGDVSSSPPPQAALEPESLVANAVPGGQSQSSEPAPLDSDCATRNELNIESTEQGELDHEEEPEQKRQLKWGDEEEEDPDPETLVQNTATEDSHHLVDPGVTEESGAACDKPFTSESLAVCHEEFATPRTEDNDETDNLACMQIIDEAQNMALISRPISESVSCSMQEETVDLSAEILGDSSGSVPELHKIDVMTDREEVTQREGNKVEEGINTVEERMNMVQSQAQEEEQVITLEKCQALGKYPQSSDMETESDEENLEEDDALGNHDIWNEFEDIICEELEHDKSKHGEEKDAREGVCNVREGDEQTGQEHEEVDQEAGNGATVSEEERKEKDDVEAFKEEVTTEVMEEGTDLSMVEGLPSENQETMSDVQRKEIESPQVAEADIDIPETYTAKEEEKLLEHQQEVTTEVMEEGTDLSSVEGLPSENQETLSDVQRKEIESPQVAEEDIDIPETYTAKEEEKPWEHQQEVTTEVMEEGTDLSLVEGLPSEDQDVQRKGIDSPQVAEAYIDIPEMLAAKEEEKPREHQQDERDGNSNEQEMQSEQKAVNEEQPQALTVVGEKEKTQSEVKTEGTADVPGQGKCEDGESRPRSEPGVGRTLVISTQTPPKVYHAKAVPIVPPKPQHCRLTALSLRQQQQQRDRWDTDRERDSSSRVAVSEHKERVAEEAGTGGQEKACTGEQGAHREGERGGSPRAKKERPVSRGGERDSEKRRDAEEGATPRHGPSMCFDEAVAMATMRRERERENGERERQRDRGHEVQ